MNQYCKNITFSVIPEQKPSHIDANYWAKAKGTAILCGYPNNTGKLVITAQNLIPLGVYTAWFITDQGAYPSSPTNVEYTADGFDPNRLIVNSKGQLPYYIAHLNYNPFIGIPNNAFGPVRSIVIAWHPDNLTHGLKPGPHNSHLSADVEP
jgi:hypothetical protein